LLAKPMNHKKKWGVTMVVSMTATVPVEQVVTLHVRAIVKVVVSILAMEAAQEHVKTLVLMVAQMLVTVLTIDLSRGTR